MGYVSINTKQYGRRYYHQVTDEGISSFPLRLIDTQVKRYVSKLTVTMGNFNCAALCAHLRMACATILLSRGWRSLSRCTTRLIITCICQPPFMRFNPDGIATCRRAAIRGD